MNTRRFGSKKKLVLAGIAGATIFGGSYGLAASLGVLTSDSLGAAETVVAACQSAPMTVSYAPAYSVTLKAYDATSVTLSGLTATCTGKTFHITLSDGTGLSLGEGTGTGPTVVAPATTAPLTVTISARASTVAGVAVVEAG